MEMEETNAKPQRKPYDTDLTDAQWAMIEPLLVRQETRGRARQADLREVVNGMLYQTRTGCQWRLLPHEFAQWTVGRYYFDTWKHDGTLVRIDDARRRAVRQELGRAAEPSAASIDSQSVKTPAARGLRGWDGGKKGQRTQTPTAGRSARLPLRRPSPCG